MTDPRVYWVGLNLVKGIGSVRFKTLVEAFGDPEAAWNASPEAWIGVGIPQKVAEAFVGCALAGVTRQQRIERGEDLGFVGVFAVQRIQPLTAGIGAEHQVVAAGRLADQGDFAEIRARAAVRATGNVFTLVH